MGFDSEDTVFHVVVNGEGQYSIWPEYMTIPNGWTQAGKTGKKQECLTYIGEVWTDMRPLSLRKHMEAHQQQQQQDSSPTSNS